VASYSLAVCRRLSFGGTDLDIDEASAVGAAFGK
jgi:hypothetical protein